jgi:hypothetical protein
VRTAHATLIVDQGHVVRLSERTALFRDVEYKTAFGYLEPPPRFIGETENAERAGDAEESTSVEKSNHPANATMRLGFWAPVYGNWIISKHPETQNASFDYTRQLTLLAEEISFATVLLAEHTFNPMWEEMARFGEQIVPLLAKAGVWTHPKQTPIALRAS